MGLLMLKTLKWPPKRLSPAQKGKHKKKQTVTILPHKITKRQNSTTNYESLLHQLLSILFVLPSILLAAANIQKRHRTQLGRLPNEIARTTVAAPQLSNPSCQSSSSVLRLRFMERNITPRFPGPARKSFHKSRWKSNLIVSIVFPWNHFFSRRYCWRCPLAGAWSQVAVDAFAPIVDRRRPARYFSLLSCYTY